MVGTRNRTVWQRQLLTPEGWRRLALRKKLQRPIYGKWRYTRFLAHTTSFVTVNERPLHKKWYWKEGTGLQCKVEPDQKIENR